MAQNMQFDEEPRGYQPTYTPTLGENTGSYNQRVAEAQKIGTFQGMRDKSASAAQRLALAIVSMIVLCIGFSMFGGAGNDNFLLVGIRLGALFIVAIAAIAINAIFNHVHD